MAACGAQACAEEKVDRPKRLFDYKPSGVKAKEYAAMPEYKFDSFEDFVDVSRKEMNKIMEPLSELPIIADAVEKTVTSEFTVKKGAISDGDITVYVHRPKALPEKGCAAMLFVHGGGAIAGRAKDFVPTSAFMSVCYEVVGVTVDYRLAPENGNKGGSDVYAVLKYVYDNAETLGIDKTRIGIEGTSAGAHHTLNAMNLMVQKEETGLCKMILTDVAMLTSVLRFTPEKDWEEEELTQGPNLDLMYEALLGDKYKENIANKDPMLFPELVGDEKLKFYPPMVLFSAEFCPMHKANMMFAQRLEKVGKLLDFRLIRGLGHMYAMSNNDEFLAVFNDRIKAVNVYLKN